MSKKDLVSEEVLQELINKLEEIVNNYCWNLEYFTDEAINEVCDKILECMNNYEEHLQDMNLFKRKCLLEPREWENMVYLIFGDMIPDENKIIKE